VHPEKLLLLAGAGPVRVIAGEPGSRPRSGKEIRPAERGGEEGLIYNKSGRKSYSVNGFTIRRKVMRNYVFGLTRKSVLFSLICLFVPNISAWAQDESLAPGINDRFKQQPDLSIKQFDFTGRDPKQQKEILDACELKPGMDVADIGAGSGVHVRLFAEKVLPAGKVYAVEIIQEFLDHIEMTCKENGIKNVVCVLGSNIHSRCWLRYTRPFARTANLSLLISKTNQVTFAQTVKRSSKRFPKRVSG
jgi:hypothetical protein